MSITNSAGKCKRCHKDSSERYRILEGNVYCRYCFELLLNKIADLLSKEVL